MDSIRSTDVDGSSVGARDMVHALFTYARSVVDTTRVTLLYAASEHGRVDVVGFA